MTYAKPELAHVGKAAGAIQGVPKQGGSLEINPPPAPNRTLTVNAYEADE